MKKRETVFIGNNKKTNKEVISFIKFLHNMKLIHDKTDIKADKTIVTFFEP